MKIVPIKSRRFEPIALELEDEREFWIIYTGLRLLLNEDFNKKIYREYGLLKEQLVCMLEILEGVK